LTLTHLSTHSDLPLIDWPMVGALNTEESCADYLFHLKWPSGFDCSSCGHRHAYIISTRRLPLFECAGCGHQTSLTAGTVMEGSRTPLTKWFNAIRLLSDTERGISALALSRILSVTYKTAWSLLHKIRFAMGKVENGSPLSGQVILHDASYARPPFYSSLAHHPKETPLLVGASLSAEGQPSRVIIQVADPGHLSDEGISPAATTVFCRDHVAVDAQVVDCQVKRYAPRRGKKALPLVQQARDWLRNTFHGIGKKYLQVYLHEFCYRTNLRMASIPIFADISRICVKTAIQWVNRPKGRAPVK